MASNWIKSSNVSIEFELRAKIFSETGPRLEFGILSLVNAEYTQSM